MEEQYTYRTISSNSTADFRDRGSKFLAYAYPVDTVEEVKEKVKLLKKEHPKAVHFCLAFRIGTDGTLYRANDDGEPSGSAGKPILGQIDSAGLTNVLVVVVRYFGGSLLGVPGLINAYKTVTSNALSESEVKERNIEQKVTISFDYPVMSEVMYLLKQADSTILKQELQLFCEIEAGIPVKDAESYINKLSEIRGVEVKKLNT